MNRPKAWLSSGAARCRREPAWWQLQHLTWILFIVSGMGCGPAQAPTHPSNAPMKALDAHTWHVRADGSGDAATIQGAMNLASDGDSVIVGPGTYYEHISFLGRDIVLSGSAGAESTILDGSHGEGAVVSFVGGEGRGAILEGFTITGGEFFPSALGAAAGIQCLEASPVIRNNRILDNMSSSPYSYTASAGGVHLFGSVRGSTGLVPEPIVEGNVFEGNETTQNGGALVVGQRVRATIRNNTFVRNRSGRDGGAIWAELWVGDVSRVWIVGNTFIGNTAGDHGGAIDIDNDSCLVELNTFVRNVAHGNDDEDFLGAGGAIAVRGGHGTIRMNTFFENVATGEDDQGGSAVLLTSGSGVRMTQNIIAFSSGSAIRCNEGSEVVSLSGNLFWMNTPVDVDTRDPGVVHSDGTDLAGDPLFCDPATGNFAVQEGSPAVRNGVAIGAVPLPGCGMGAGFSELAWSPASSMRGRRHW